MANKAIVDQDLIARLITRPREEDPVVSLYLRGWGAANDRKATLKNLIKEGEEQIAADTGWDDERKKEARKRLEQVRAQAEALLSELPTQGRGGVAIFSLDGLEPLRLPVDMRDRVVVDRSPYASPLSSLIDQFERYAVILCDKERARIFDVYLDQLEDWEEVQGDSEVSRHAPAGGPSRSGGGGPVSRGGGGAKAPRTGGSNPAAGSGYHGLEELRRRNHAEYVLHQHLQVVADRAFRRYKLRPYERLILAGAKEIVPLLEDHLHSYLKQRVVAREQMAVDLSQSEARKKVRQIETQVEARREKELLEEINNRLGQNGLGTVGLDETLRSLVYGKVRTLVVMGDGDPLPGRECPECHFLFERPEDAGETTPTLVECPQCKRATRRVPDIIDEAVELAILSGARVTHVAHAKAELEKMGGMAAVLRFK